MTWRRLKESEINDGGPALPTRMVLDYEEEEGTYRTFMESIPEGGKSIFYYGRTFGT